MTDQNGGGTSLPGVTSDGTAPPYNLTVDGHVTALGAVLGVDGVAIEVGVILITDSTVIDPEFAASTSIDHANVQSRSLQAVTGNDNSVNVHVHAGQASSPIWVFDDSGNSIFELRTDGGLNTSAAVTHALGAYTGKAYPIYNAAGTLLGYLPIYA